MRQSRGRAGGWAGSTRRRTTTAVAGALWVVLLAGAAACGADEDVDDDALLAVGTVKVTTCLDQRLLAYEGLLRHQWNTASEADRAHWTQVWSCVAEAQECAAVLQCFYGRDPVWCTELRRWCDGGWLVTCSGPETWAQLESCPLNGEECLTENDSSVCGVGSCNVGHTPGYCEGNAVHICRYANVYERQSCGQNTCFQDGSRAVCGDELTDGPCNSEPSLPVGSNWCDGDDILACASLYVRRRSSCKERDPAFTCVPNPSCDPHLSGCSTAACAMPPGSEECSQGYAACVGNELQFCDRGKLRTFDCAALPGAQCVDVDCVL